MKNIHRIDGNTYITNDEEIKDGDCILHNNKIHKVRINKGLYLTLYEFEHIDVRADICKKIILTTDQDLIKDGVQAIDDKLLEWFVKNPSCDYVETRYSYPTIDDEGDGSISEGYWLLVIPKENKIYRECPNGCRGKLSYLTKDECLCSCGTKWNIKTNKIIIPKEEPKQETLEEFAKRRFNEEKLNTYTPYNIEDAIIEGAKWQQQKNKNFYSEEEVRKMLEDATNYVSAKEMRDNYEMNFSEWKRKKEWFVDYLFNLLKKK